MTAGNYVITGRLDRTDAAGENGCCGFTYFLESSCCCVIVGLLPWTLFIYSPVVSGVVHC